MSNTLKFGNGKWAIKEGSTLAYNDENGNFKPLPFTFDRAGSATRVNKQGLIEVVSDNEPRIDFSNDSKGALLLEPQRSNQMTYSENLTSWTKQSGVTITLESINNPVNSTNASLITVNTNGAFQNRTTPNASALYSVSFWLHKNSESGTIQISNAQGDASGLWTINLDLLQNDFVRITKDHPSVTVVNEFVTLGDGNIAPFFKSPTGTKSFYVTGFQLEEGSYATSYIPTQGSIGTRMAEICIDAGNEQVINSTEGTLFLHFKAFKNDTSFRYLAISDGTVSNRVVITLDNIYRLQSAVSLAGVTQSNVIKQMTNDSLSNGFKVAMTYKNNEFKSFVNGVETTPRDTSGSVFPTGTLKYLRFTQGNTTSGPLNGETSAVQYYNTALSDAELITLTTL